MGKLFGIHPDEQVAAAKYFAMSNTAMIETVEKVANKNIDKMYSLANSIVANETGVTLTEEFYSWLDNIKKATPNSYEAKRWKEVKSQYIIE